MKLQVSADDLAGCTRNWRVADLPLALYEEVSRHFGTGDEETYESNVSPTGAPADNWWRKRHLDPKHPVIGRPTTILLQQLHGIVYFKFWNCDTSKADDFERNYPILDISAGPQSAGVWAYGRGNLIADNITIHLTGDLPLTDPRLRIMGLIIFRASQLSQNPNCIKDRYWEVQKDPSRDFTEP